LLLTDRQSVQINPSAAANLDIHQIDQRLEAVQVHDHLNLAGCGECIGSLEQVVSLYQGNFLTNFYLEDSTEFEGWAEANREAYRVKALETLETLTEANIQKRAFQEAIQYAERQIQIDPLREIAYRQLMELYSKSGQRTEALRIYQRCTRILEIELGTGPSRETTALYEIISGEDLRDTVTAPREGYIRGYQIREHLGSGHTGIVYRAFQPVINRDVAIKVIQPQFANHPDFIRRFEVEAQLVARLEHPHIVPLYDYWRDPTGAYLVMRWLKGGSLQAALDLGPWKAAKAVRLVNQVAEALALAHYQGVVHCDIKPANILLDEEGNAYLSDFGIAILTGQLAQFSQVMSPSARISSPGSLGYTSPEATRGQEITPLTDIYSLGVVLYELLTGMHPFRGLEGETLIQQHLTEPLPSVQTLRAELPAGVDEVIQKATEKEPGQRYPDVNQLAKAFRAVVSPGMIDVTEKPAVTHEMRNPYKGLRSFEEADSRDFFGRNQLVARLLERLSPLDEITPGERFIAVVGPSGSGKSSAVKAGLVPAVRRSEIPGSEDWFIVEMTPGAHPLDELESALLQIAIETPEDFLSQLKSEGSSLLRVLQKALPGVKNDVLLVIDQFEELFTLVEEEAERKHFLDMLVRAVSDPHSTLRLVITLRADFFDRPLEYGEFGELIQKATEVVLPLNPEELERAISGPAEQVGVQLEPGLVAHIVQEVGDQPGALPLLQYALTESFELREGSQLSLATYEAGGGLLAALGRRAEEIYQNLDENQKVMNRQLFLRLVTLGEGTEDTRRRVLLAEIEAIDGGSQGGFHPVTDPYVRYRLITFDHDPSTRAPTVELAHEALLREWLRLRAWLDESRDDIRLQRLLAAATLEWEVSGQKASYLLRGSRLEQFDQWVRESDLALSGDEQTYLEASLAARQERQAAEAERQAYEAHLEQRSRRFLWALVSVFAVAALTAVILSVVAFNQSSIAQENAATATYAQGEALLLAYAEATSAAEALDQKNIAEEEAEARATQQAIAEEETYARATQQAIAEAEVIARATAQAEAETAKEDALRQASIGLAAQTIQELSGPNPESAVLLALDALKNYPYTWQAERALSQAVLESRLRMIIPSESEYVHHDMSPDGTKLLSGQVSGAVSVYEFPGGKELFRLTDGEPNAAAWSPNGSKILSVIETAFQMWDAAGNQQYVKEADPEYLRCKWQPWAPEGDRFAIGEGDGTAPVFDADTGEPLLVLDGHDTELTTTIWSPSGDFILTTAKDNKAILWDADSGEILHTLPGTDMGIVIFLAWSPSEKYLALGGDGVHVYDIKTGEKFFEQPGNLVWGGEWSPDGDVLVTTTLYGGEARAWDAKTGDPIGSITDLMQGWDVTWSPSGDFVAVGGDSVRIWDPRSDHELLRLTGIDSELRALYWSPNGETIVAAGTFTNYIKVFDLTTAELTINGASGVAASTWSPDGSKIARNYQDGTVIIYDVSIGDEIISLDSGTDWGDTAWSPDGNRLLSFNSDNTLKIWDVVSGDLEMLLTDHHHEFLFSGDWSPDGGRIVTMGFDVGRPIIWDAYTGEKLLIFEGHQQGGGIVSWSPDGNRIASTGFDGKVMVWDAETGEVLLDLLPEGYSNWGAGVKWSNEGSRIAAFDGDGFGHIFNAQTGEELAKLCCHDSAWKITWSPTDERILTVGADGTGRVWDVESGAGLIVYDIGGFPSGGYSPDGTKVLLATGDGTTRIFPTLHDPQELIDYAKECCIVRELTPDEREQFGLPEKE
jgi:WD40 repeat protein/serine/threonine protein kinase